MGHQLLVPKDELLSKYVLRVVRGETHAYSMDLDFFIIKIGEVCSLDVVTMGGALCSSAMIEDVENEVFMDSTDESSLMNHCETGSKLSCSEAITVSFFQGHLDYLLDNKVNQIHESTPDLVFCHEGVHVEASGENFLGSKKFWLMRRFLALSSLTCRTQMIFTVFEFQKTINQVMFGEEATISEMEIVYKLDSRALVSKSSPSKFRT
nr:hypothetical protein [Tanacetum cinerariifolium]